MGSKKTIAKENIRLAPMVIQLGREDREDDINFIERDSTNNEKMIIGLGKENEDNVKNPIEANYTENEKMCIGLGKDDQNLIPIQKESIKKSSLVIKETTTDSPPVEANQFEKKDDIDESENRTSTRHVDFMVCKDITTNYELLSCNNSIYLGNGRFFNKMTETDLRVFIKKNIRPELDAIMKKHHYDEVIYRLQTSPELQTYQTELDKEYHLINVQNGVYNVITDEILDHGSEYLFTSALNASIYPLYSGYLNRVRRENCFMEFLNVCTKGDSLKIDSIQECLGYLFSNFTTVKKFFAVIGKPHSGKSTLLELIRRIVGFKQTTAIPLHKLADRFMTAELFESKINISGEMPDGELKGIDMIKKITGNDVLQAERKGKDPFTFICNTKLIVAGNHMPLPNKLDSTSAFTSRIVFLIFNNTVSENKRNHQLLDDLWEERDFIVSWAMEGLTRLIENNYTFTECDEAQQFRKQYLKNMNNSLEFIKEQCSVDLYNNKLRIHRKDLYALYNHYCRENCVTPLEKREFFEQVLSIGVKGGKFRINGSSPLEGFIGLGLKPNHIY